MLRPAWLMAPRVRNHLRFLREASGNLLFPEVREGQLLGFPLFATTAIPTNLGAGTESEVYLVDMADCLIAEEAGIEISVSDGAAYHDGAEVIAAFSQDQTVVRAVAKHDFALRHDRSAAVLNAVTWGA
jgi:HK97 family phage major capsid protein